MPSRPSSALYRPNSMNCWLWFSCMKHWEAAGKNDATYEKHVLAPMSVNCYNFQDPVSAYRKPRPGPLRLPQGPCNILHSPFCILLISNVLRSFGQAHRRAAPSLQSSGIARIDFRPVLIIYVRSTATRVGPLQSLLALSNRESSAYSTKNRTVLALR